MIFKDYHSEESVLTFTPYGLANQLINIYGNKFSGYQGEILIETLGHSTLNYFPVSVKGIVDALYYLNARIEAARKTLSTWDAYQIYGTLQDRDTVLAQFSQLPANSSIISNLSEPYQWNKSNDEIITIHKGDVIFKDYNENLHFIKSLSSGYYAPMEMENTKDAGGNPINNNITITYQYFTDQPGEGTYNGNEDNAPQRTHEFQVNLVSEESGYNYFGTIEPEGYREEEYKFSPSNVRLEPVIKFYTENENDEKEEIFLDIVYFAINEEADEEPKFRFENPTPGVLYYEVK